MAPHSGRPATMKKKKNGGNNNLNYAKNKSQPDPNDDFRIGRI